MRRDPLPAQLHRGVGASITLGGGAGQRPTEAWTPLPLRTRVTMISQYDRVVLGVQAGELRASARASALTVSRVISGVAY